MMLREHFWGLEVFLKKDKVISKTCLEVQDVLVQVVNGWDAPGGEFGLWEEGWRGRRYAG